MWLGIDGFVYDVTKFAKLHPGGPQIIEQFAGLDVTTLFYEVHKQEVLTKYAKLRVGRLDTAVTGEKTVSDEDVISSVPFAEIPAFQGQHSPYYTESHRVFLRAVRTFVQTELEPLAEAADLSGELPDRDLQQKLGSSGVLGCRLGPGPWLREMDTLGIKIPGGVSAEEFDFFHEMLVHQEFGRIGRPGFVDSLGTGWIISAPTVYNFGNESQKRSFGPQLLKGEKWSVLAISEPFAGSDVAALRCTAKLSEDGQHYIVNGLKKWITEGMYADYFVTAVRTGDNTAAGISLLVIERGPGLETKQIKTTYSTCCGTALVLYNNVKVPVANLLGKEGDGFKAIMYNFNHERWFIVCNLVGQARAAVADTFKWSKQRKIFGKLLIDQPVIRNKLASAAAALESIQTYLEAITYDMCKAKGGAVGPRLAGPIAMLKYQSTRVAWKVADDCVQIFGGRGITRTGMGHKVEGFKNYAKYAAVYGGSEEIMADLAIKQAMRSYPARARL
jgi:alkylation response protein AidB-like acyl-CoA dehydrogenase